MFKCEQCEDDFVDVLEMEADEYLEFQLTGICHECQRENRGENEDRLIKLLNDLDEEFISND